MAFPLTLTVAELASLYGLGRSSAYDAVTRGDVAAIRLGGRLLVPTAPVLRQLGHDEEQLLPILRRLPAMLTTQRAAKLLRVSTDLVYEAIAAGQLPAHKIGNAYRLPTAKILRLLGVSEPLIDELRRTIANRRRPLSPAI